MVKKIYFLGLSSGVLAAIASVVYARIYNSSLGSDFSKIVALPGILASCEIGGILAATGYWLFTKFMQGKGEIVFSFLFVLLSFVSIMGPFAATLPVDIKNPELFPGLTVPMHFFPALAWFVLKPLFIRQQQ